MQEKEQKISPIKQRILQFADSLGISKRVFYAQIGVSRGTLEAKTGITEDIMAKFIAAYPEVSINWLVTGNGEIFTTKTPKNTIKSNDGKIDGEIDGKRKLQKTPSNTEYPKGEESFEKNVADVTVDKVFKLRTDRLIDRQQIPIYDMEAVAGLVPLFADQYSQSIVEVMETTLIPKCDGGLRIVGDSMYPLLKSGDIVFYKQVHDIMHSIIWGEMYLISFDIDGDEYVSVKYLQKSDTPDHIVLVSYNEHHKPMEIHINRIRALAFIKASLRLNSLK
uniref:S24 family peptidase n=1 Tax=Alistipes shahii TaxID=328814 RepID=UPI002659C8D7|nr:S24 family peptidase [Alistipes shahii]